MPKIDTTGLAFPKVVKRGKIDKSALVIAEPIRLRSKAHLDWIRSLPCSVPGCRHHSAAHHLTISPEGKGRGVRAGDDWAVPLCHGHHQGQGSVHFMGDEADWWKRLGIDPIALCADLRRRSPALNAAAELTEKQKQQPANPRPSDNRQKQS
jgi:hypothetical protein